MRPRFRHEILSFSLVVSLPVAMALVFPYEAIGFKPAKSASAATAHAAFVTLTAEEEAAAVKAARASWRVSASEVRAAELQIEELPERPLSAVLGFEDRGGFVPVKAMAYELPPYYPTSAAPSAPRLPARTEAPRTPAFSRKELLSAQGL